MVVKTRDEIPPFDLIYWHPTDLRPADFLSPVYYALLRFWLRQAYVVPPPAPGSAWGSRSAGRREHPTALAAGAHLPSQHEDQDPAVRPRFTRHLRLRDGEWPRFGSLKIQRNASAA